MEERIEPIRRPATGRPGPGLPRWLAVLLDAGIASADPLTRRAQRFTNIAAFAMAANAVGHFITNVLHDAHTLAAVNIYNIVIAILYLSLPWLHRFGETIAANALILISLVGHTYVVFAMGTEANLHVYFTLAGFILFLVGVRHWRNFLLLYVLCGGALLASMLFASEDGFVIAADEAFRHSMAIQAMMSAFLLNGAVIASVLLALDRAERELQREYERSELLLTTILPASISERLKTGLEDRIADSLDNVAVMFTDLVGFTPAAAKVSPVELVDYLHRLFSRFDALCDKHEVDKIKTIGDAYMAVGGLRDDGGTGVNRMARLAIEMLEVAREEHLTDKALQLRVGIHFGPVVAGVIGDRRMTYDMWGDTVNFAARLESHGVPGRIHVSREFRDAAAKSFDFEPHGTLDIKGFGKRETWFLRGTKEG